MSGSLTSDVTDSLTDLGEEVSAALPEGIPQIPDAAETVEQEVAGFDLPLVTIIDRIEDVSGSAFALEVADILANLDLGLDVNRLEGLIDRLPPEQRGPDSTGEVATGLSSFSRAELAVGASLAAVPRVLDALGPDAYAVSTPGTYFTVITRYEDNESGFSAVRLRPADGGPEVFAIDGLEVGSTADTVAALDLGGLQMRSAAFGQMVADAAASYLTEGRPSQFVGPSLGGAVAQAAAHEAAQALLAIGVPIAAGAVRLVTVDSLGGRDATEQLNGGVLDPAALALINGLNIRTEGDLITRIGSHIGETLNFAPVDSAGQPVTLSTEDAHVNVESLLATLNSDSLTAAGVRGAPEEISGFAQVTNAVGRLVADGYLASGERDDPDRMVPLQVPGVAGFDASGTIYVLDGDENGTHDLAVALTQPVSPAVADLVL